MYEGTIEERFPIAALGDYTLEQRSAAPFPLAPLFEMLGEPPPGAHERGDPSIETVGREFAEDGIIPLKHLSVLRDRREVYHERVVRGLSRMRLARERQRDFLLALPGVRSSLSHPAEGFCPRSIPGAAAEIWAGLNGLLSREIANVYGDYGGIGGGVLASSTVLGSGATVVSRDMLYHILVEYLDVDRYYYYDETEEKFFMVEPGRYNVSIGEFQREADHIAAEMVELQDEWLALYEETLEDDRCRQLYEIVVSYVVEGVRAFPVAPKPPTSTETEYLDRVASALLVHDREPGDLLRGAKLALNPRGETGRAGRYMTRKGLGSMTQVFNTVDHRIGNKKGTTYRYLIGSFKDNPHDWNGFGDWSMKVEVWFEFAGRHASALVARGDAAEVEYNG